MGWNPFKTIGNIVQGVFGGSQSREESNQYSQEQMRLSQQFNLENMEIQQGYTQENMALQNQYNIEAFNRENEYNTPLAQKQRAYQAGINPNWQDGAGVVAQQDSGVSPASPSSSTPGPVGTTSSPVDPSSLIGSIKDMSKFVTDLKKTKAETKLIENQAKLAQTQEKAQAIAAGILQQYGNQEAEARINEMLENASNKRVSTNEIQVLLEAKKYLIEQQGENQRSQADYTNTLDYIQEYNANYRDQMFNVMYGPDGVYPSQANYYNQSARFLGTQNQYYPRVVAAQEGQAKAALQQAAVARANARINEANGKALRSLYAMEEKLAGSNVGKTNAEAYNQWLNNHRDEVENDILDAMQEAGLPLKERRAQIKVWEEDAELKRLEQEFKKAETVNEKAKIGFGIADRLIELCPKIHINYNIGNK